MRYILLITFFIISSRSKIYSQTTGESYPNGTSCRYAISIDSGDTLWAGSSATGLQKCFNDTCYRFTTSNSGISNNRINAVSVDSSDNIWTGSYSGICVYNHSTWNYYTTLNSGLPNDTILCIANTVTGTWIGTNAGLTFFDGSNWTTWNTSNSGILNDTVKDIAFDNSTVYLAHTSGISRFNSNWTTWILPVNNLNYGRTLEVAAGRLWVNDVKVLYYLDQNNFRNFSELVNNFNPRYSYYWPQVNSAFNCIGISADKNGWLFFMAYTGGYGPAVFRILPNLTINFSEINPSNFTNGSPLLQASLIRDSTYYSVTFTSGLKRVRIDSNTFKNISSIKGTENDFLDINNATARILNRGDLHWDPVGQYPQYYSDTYSTRHPVYSSAIWLGGLDQGGILHTAAMTYRQQGSADFWTGPLDTISGAADTVSEAYYDRFWKIDFDMIKEFQINYANGNLQNGSYNLPEAIATWPAHGTGNHTRKLAPFIDANSDGVYNPYDGDYPELTGHQMLWWVFNDALYTHTETMGPAFGFEIQGKAYGYNCNLNNDSDAVMNNTTFYQYTITNRSQNTYHNVHIGLWTDFDLGNASDDYVGCDTMLNTYFCYNGDNDDDGNYGYGLNPPMMNVSFLKGPVVQSADGYDNNHNGITDEAFETAGMSTFLFYVTANNIPTGDPATTDDYYEYLTGLWLDGQHWTYGENGRNPANPETNYLFSGIPFAIPNQWTMTFAGMQPSDMRGIGASGPFTIAPGESQTIDFAYIFTRDSLNPNGLTTSIAKNTADVQKIINGFNSGNYPCLTSVGIPQLAKQQLDFNVYPNPVTNTLYFNKEMLGAEFEIFSITGQLVNSGIMSDGGISIEKLQSQLYIIKAVKNGQSYVKRFVKM